MRRLLSFGSRVSKTPSSWAFCDTLSCIRDAPTRAHRDANAGGATPPETHADASSCQKRDRGLTSISPLTAAAAMLAVCTTRTASRVIRRQRGHRFAWPLVHVFVLHNDRDSRLIHTSRTRNSTNVSPQRKSRLLPGSDRFDSPRSYVFDTMRRHRHIRRRLLVERGPSHVERRRETFTLSASATLSGA